ncbi:AFG1/ZapE family ATPase [Pseudomonas coronafaciens]|uniref:AFG1/ZapE family ATPase n=1 Tax=Pseudomonas coronafaciens TaxID=53409 RepID=UPI000F00AAA3|nr:AFG1/ZapE family ATPase [Pseudomonas coronafaciens]RMV62085.1 hypothetical protein ALP06_200308 [Pseudomonas coronafaciens pv. atropurpurea]
MDRAAPKSEGKIASYQQTARQQPNAWLDFEDLCRLPRSSADFLWLSRTFKRLAITAVPTLDGESIDVQQRFLNLIDILYDSGIELTLITEEGPQALLTATALLDYARTCSQLQQLRILELESMDRVIFDIVYSGCLHAESGRDRRRFS